MNSTGRRKQNGQRETMRERERELREKRKRKGEKI
jgi:hypothetical protein